MKSLLILMTALPVLIAAERGKPTPPLENGAVLDAKESKMFDEPIDDSKMVAKEFVTITFDSSQSTMTQEDKEELAALVRKSQGSTVKEKYLIATWSDKPMPKGDKQLLERDEDLAAIRGENIKSVLDDYGAKNIQVYNMAKKASWLANAINLEEAQLKKAMIKKSSIDLEKAKLAEILNREGGASKAVVIVESSQPLYSE